MGCSYDRDKTQKKKTMCSSHTLGLAVDKTEWKKKQDNDSPFIFQFQFEIHESSMKWTYDKNENRMSFWWWFRILDDSY